MDSKVNLEETANGMNQDEIQMVNKRQEVGTGSNLRRDK